MKMSAAVIQGPAPASIDTLRDMAPFFLTVALPKPRCISNGQLTPPPSPNHVVTRTAQYQIKRRFQSPKAGTQISHCPMVTSSHARTLCSEPQQKSPGVHQYHLDDDPFTRTPHSPSMLSDSVLIHTSTVRQCQLVRPLSELRRISRTFYDLRSIAQDQEKEFEEGQEPEHRTLLETAENQAQTPALLPSPLFDDLKMNLYADAATPHAVNHLPETKPWTTETAHKSVDVMQILSCYEDNPYSPWDDTGEVIIKRSSTMPDVSALPPIGSNSPSWMANGSFTEHIRSRSTDSTDLVRSLKPAPSQERLRKFKARCYQIVQHPFRASGEQCDEEGTIMLATVLIGPGKPKLVQIQRPTSTNNSPRSLSVRSTLSSDQDESAVPTPPCTPPRQCKEVSAFSPYDTPSVATSFGATISPPYNTTSVQRTPLAVSKLDIESDPLRLSRRGSSDSEQSTLTGAERRVRTLAKNLFGYSISPRKPSSTNTTTTTSSDDELDISIEDLAFTKSSPRAVKRNRMQRKLDAITTAIDSFPTTMLDLASPIVIDLRLLPCERKNNLHIENLSKIFTNAPKQILSSLAAWIIIDSFIASLHLEQTPERPVQRKLSVPITTKQPTIPPRSVSVGSNRYDAIYESFPLPPPSPSRSTSIVTADSNSDQVSIDIIPLKARSILGLDQQTPWLHSDEQLLATRAKALSLSINVVAQKLVEVLRGEGGWDAYFWRALGAVVGVVEESDL